MKLTVPFTQTSAIATFESSSGSKLATRGLCFRVAFKWAACRAVGGEFKFLKLNASKTADKHLQYRQASLKLEQDPTFDFADDANIKTYVVGDQIQAETYLTQWGKNFKDANKNEFSVTPGKAFAGDIAAYLSSNPIGKVKGIVYGFYGRTFDKKGPRGHAVALSGGGHPLFFDPNTGEHEFDSGEDIGAAINNYIKSRYTNWTQELFYVMPLN